MDGLDLERVRVIGLWVYRRAHSDCTNGGVSAREDQVYLIHPEGATAAWTVPFELVFRGEDAGGGYHRLVPIVGRSGRVGPMDGGNLAATSDSRVPHVYHIHDRWETQEHYDLLTAGD